MSKRFRPLSDRILIKPESAPVKLGGLAVPDSQKDEPTEGIVVAVGPDAIKRVTGVDTIGRGQIVQRFNAGVAVGETVAWRKYSGRDVTVDGETFKLIRLDELDGAAV